MDDGYGLILASIQFFERPYRAFLRNSPHPLMNHHGDKGQQRHAEEVSNFHANFQFSQYWLGVKCEMNTGMCDSSHALLLESLLPPHVS